MIYDPTTWPAWGFIAFVSFYALAGWGLAVWERWVDRLVCKDSPHAD